MNRKETAAEAGKKTGGEKASSAINAIAAVLVIIGLASGNGNIGFSVMVIAALAMIEAMKMQAALFWKKVMAAVCMLAAITGCTISAIGFISEEKNGYAIILVLFCLLICGEACLLLSREIRKQKRAEAKAKKKRKQKGNQTSR